LRTLAQDDVEAIDTLAPELVGPLDPGGGLGERLSPEAKMMVATDHGSMDEAGVLEDPNVLRRCGQGDPESGRQTGDTAALGRQTLEHAPPCRVGQRPVRRI
jgi:hypothetical protein